MLFLILFMFADDNKAITDTAQLWAMIGLVLAFVIDMIRRTVQRRWDKQDRLQEKEDERLGREQRDAQLKLERDALALQASREREEIALRVAQSQEQVKVELQLAEIKRAKEAEKQNNNVIKKIEAQEVIVKEIDEKVVTVEIADHHKDEVISVIKEKEGNKK